MRMRENVMIKIEDSFYELLPAQRITVLIRARRNETNKTLFARSERSFAHDFVRRRIQIGVRSRVQSAQFCHSFPRRFN